VESRQAQRLKSSHGSIGMGRSHVSQMATAEAKPPQSPGRHFKVRWIMAKLTQDGSSTIPFGMKVIARIASIWRMRTPTTCHSRLLQIKQIG
jgi:hypothetical protein